MSSHPCVRLKYWRWRGLYSPEGDDSFYPPQFAAHFPENNAQRAAIGCNVMREINNLPHLVILFYCFLCGFFWTCRNVPWINTISRRPIYHLAIIMMNNDFHIPINRILVVLHLCCLWHILVVVRRKRVLVWRAGCGMWCNRWWWTWRLHITRPCYCCCSWCYWHRSIFSEQATPATVTTCIIQFHNH